MSRLTPRLPLRIAAGAALVAALALAGCGRKGGLDPPPAATYVDPAVAAVPATEEIGPDGRPRPAQPAPLAPASRPLKRWTPIDWLID